MNPESGIPNPPAPRPTIDVITSGEQSAQPLPDQSDVCHALGSDGLTLVARVEGESDGLTFSWSPTNGLTNPNGEITVAAPGIDTLYELEVTNADGAVGTASLLVRVLDCDDGNGCTTDGCVRDQDTFICVNTAADVPCDDGNPCTTDDMCNEGACAGIPVLACDDGDACTVDDACTDGACAGVPVACDDGVFCNGVERCEDGICVEGAAPCPPDACDEVARSCECGEDDDCDDGNPCTAGLCTVGACSFLAVSGSCNDGDSCTVDDVCVSGTCVGTPRNCDDGNNCTTDTCADAACANTPIAGCCQTVADCDDGDTCTQDSCVSNVCLNTSLEGCPTANAGNDVTVVDDDGVGQVTVELDGTGSSDPDGGILSCRWLENDQEIATACMPTVQLSVGPHVITLEVTDDEGLVANDEVTVDVRPPLTVSLEDRTVANQGIDGAAITLAASAEGGVPPYSFRWLRNDVEFSTQEQPTITLPIAIHSITIEVTDARGTSISETGIVGVVVGAGANNSLAALPTATSCAELAIGCVVELDPIIGIIPQTVDGLLQMVTVKENPVPDPFRLLTGERMFVSREVASEFEVIQLAVENVVPGGQIDIDAVTWIQNGVPFSSELEPLTLLASGTHLVQLDVGGTFPNPDGPIPYEAHVEARIIVNPKPETFYAWISGPLKAGEGETVQLIAQTSGAIGKLSYQWNAETRGQSPVVLSSTDQPITSFVFTPTLADVGVRISLTVVDGSGAVDFSRINIPR